MAAFITERFAANLCGAPATLAAVSAHEGADVRSSFTIGQMAGGGAVMITGEGWTCWLAPLDSGIRLFRGAKGNPEIVPFIEAASREAAHVAVIMDSVSGAYRIASLHVVDMARTAGVA